MTKPSRPSNSVNASGESRCFLVSTGTAGRKSIFQTERMAGLFIEVLRSSMREKRILIHEFVVMPDHVHLLLTVPGSMSLEKAVQLIKGGFSFRAKKELGYAGEVWQRGFSDVRITDEASFHRHCEHIRQNPVKAGLAGSPEGFRFGSLYLKIAKQAGAKARPSFSGSSGTTEVVP